MRFYQTLLGSADANSTNGDIKQLRSLLSSKLVVEMHPSLISEVSTEEIISLIKNMPSNKSLGFDGYTVKFFRAALELVSKQVIAAVQEFFSGKLLKEFKSTIISLVPKSSQPIRITNFMLISCCNIICKPISKI